MALTISLRTDKCFDLVKAYLDSKAFGGFCVREVAGTNEHWHWYLEVSGVRNIQAFRVALTRAAPDLKGNGAYSATDVKDVDKYTRYMCKGESEGAGPEVSWRNSILYDDDKVEELHVAYWTENKNLKKRKVGSMIDSVLDDCKREGLVWTDRDKIAELYLREVIKRARPLNTYSAKSACNTIQVLLCPGDEAIQMFAATV